MIHITRTIAIDEREIEESFIRASGPGGQNVNKLSTAVQLRFDVRHSPNLPPDVKMRLQAIAGTVPSLFDLKPGCRFADRCPHAFEPCRVQEPPLAPPKEADAVGQTVRCWLHTPPADSISRAA